MIARPDRLSGILARASVTRYGDLHISQAGSAAGRKAAKRRETKRGTARLLRELRKEGTA